MSILNKIINYKTIQIEYAEINRLGEALVKGVLMKQMCQLVIYDVLTSYNVLINYSVNE